MCYLCFSNVAAVSRGKRLTCATFVLGNVVGSCATRGNKG